MWFHKNEKKEQEVYIDRFRLGNKLLKHRV